MEQYIPRPSDLVPLLPGAGAGFLLLLGAVLLARAGRFRPAALLGALSLAIGHGVTYFWIQGVPAFPPVQSTERMVYAVGLFALCAVLFDGVRQSSRLLLWLLRTAAVAGMFICLVYPLMARSAEDASCPGWREVFLVAAVLAASWIVIDGLAARVAALPLVLVLSLMLGLQGQIFVMYGGAKLAQLSGSAALALGASALFFGARPNPRLVRAAACAFFAVPAGIGLDGLFFLTEPPPLLSLVLPLAGPLLLALFPAEKPGALRPKLRLVLRMIAALIPLALAFWIALAPVLARPPDPYGNMY